MTGLADARRAGTDDLGRIADLAAQARRELSAERGGPLWRLREAGPDPRPEQLAARADERMLLVAGTFDGVTVGYATAAIETLRDGSRLAVLSEIYVDPAARGIGVGERMMDLVLSWCADHHCQGIDSLALPGMRDSKNFFERFGLKARLLVVHRALEDR